MGLADSVGQALGIKSSGLTMQPGFRETPAENRTAMENRLSILNDEQAGGDTSSALGREISSTQTKIGDAPNGLAASIEAALKTPVETKKPNTATPEVNKHVNAIQANLAPATAVGETAAHVVSGIGNTIIGGWRGLAELARGGKLEDAVAAVHGTDENAVAKQYQPETEGGKLGAEVMASKYNPLNWPGMAFKKGGEVAQDLGASPGVATAIETGGNALMLAAGARSGGKAAANPVIEAGKPRIKLKVQEAPKLEFQESLPVSEGGVKLPAAEQTKRVALLQRVGVERARKSAVEGDRQAAADDFQQSKLNNAGGQVMKATLEHEREALAGHAEKIVQESGGTLGMDESARMARGNAILAPLDSFKQWFDTNIRSLYKAADEKAGGVPVELPEVHNFVKDHKANFLGTTEGKSLLEGVNERMKSLGMVDAEGNAVPVTVAQAEKLNQYLGEVWTPRTGKLIREMKDSILEGVGRAAGEDVYKQARALRAMRAATLDNPNGISKIMDASGPEGINRAIPVEKIADSVTGMPVEQLKHVVKTLENVPKELAPQSQAALGEIRAQFANKILEVGGSQSGQWNAKGVTKYLRANAEKMQAVFTPEQMAKFSDLNDAGHILAKDQSYPGAAVQEHNLVQRGAMETMRGAGAATGGFIAGAPGAAAGGYLGGMAAKKFGEGASLRATQKRVVRLSDFPK